MTSVSNKHAGLLLCMKQKPCDASLSTHKELNLQTGKNTQNADDRVQVSHLYSPSYIINPP